MRGLLLAAVLGLSACEGGGDPVQGALRDAAAARHSAATKETADVPVAASSADGALVSRMIEAERQALAAAEVLSERTSDPQLRRLAEQSRAAHRDRIAELQAWRPTV